MRSFVNCHRAHYYNTSLWNAIFVSPHFLLLALNKEDRCLHVALPVAAFLEMLAKSVTTRATTATRTGCVQRGMGLTTPFLGRSSRNAAEDNPLPNILQLNTEGLTDNKISVIEQPAYKSKAFIIVLQETHCITRVAKSKSEANFHFWGPRLF